MDLYLMRRAVALEPVDFFQDSERPLSEKGRNKMEEITRSLARLEVSFDLILTSPYLCARQSADLVAEALNLKPKYVVESENLAPPGCIDRLVEEINARGSVEFLLLVGHEPFLSLLIGMLVAGEVHSRIEMQPAGLCKLSLKRLICGRCATLEWLMTPAQLAKI